jgi:hypothetical protein
MRIKSLVTIAAVTLATAASAASAASAAPAPASHGAQAKSAFSPAAAAQRTWTAANLDRLASAYSALNPGWVRPR